MDANKQQRASQYESYIMDWFYNVKAINLSHYHLKEEQIHKGENRQGIEIKNDQSLKKTGNVFISTKRMYNYNGKVVEHLSGIYKDQSWMYVIGDKCEHWVFSTKLLKQYFEKYNPELKSGFVSEKKGTEWGFLLSREQADKICIDKYKAQQELVL